MSINMAWRVGVGKQSMSRSAARVGILAPVSGWAVGVAGLLETCYDT